MYDELSVSFSRGENVDIHRFSIYDERQPRLLLRRVGGMNQPRARLLLLKHIHARCLYLNLPIGLQRQQTRLVGRHIQHISQTNRLNR